MISLLKLDITVFENCISSVEKAKECITLSAVEAETDTNMYGYVQLQHSYEQMIELVNNFNRLLEKDIAALWQAKRDIIDRDDDIRKMLSGEQNVKENNVLLK